MPNKVAHVVILLLCTGDHLPARRKKSHMGKRQRKALGASKSSPPGACTCLCRPDQRQSVRKKRKKKSWGEGWRFRQTFSRGYGGPLRRRSAPASGLTVSYVVSVPFPAAPQTSIKCVTSVSSLFAFSIFRGGMREEKVGVREGHP